ncbi:MAG: 2Fe-2S iron-sulfur cluster-binding protein [Candidatus Micrarchaeota archaeon]
MAKVVVKTSSEEVEVADGTILAELDGKCSVLYGCKSGTCGSCMVKVTKGMENLEAPNEIEKSGLEVFANSPNQRLMCQCKIKKGEIEIEF